MTCPTSEKLRSQLRVIDNPDFKEATKSGAPSTLTVVDDGISNDLACGFMRFLAVQYHLNKLPTQFDDNVVVHVVDLPDNGIINRTIAMMTAVGWSIELNEHNCAGGRAGEFYLCPPPIVDK